MVKRLRQLKKQKAGRSRGKITVRHRGGGHKRLYRFIDFNYNQKAKILAIEYDPNRSANIALVQDKSGKKSYVLASTDMKVGEAIKPRLKLQDLSVGANIYNVAGMIKSAGATAVLQAIEAGYAQIKLPSGEIRLVKENELANIGQVSNPEHNTKRLRKAGQNRWRGIRPTVRGSAMAAGDHPHGGGEGRSPIGLKHPKTPWGKPALGKKTRQKSKLSNKFIIKSRKKKQKS
ncbi:MAG: 50S ribosomal protein L2 [Candidatus Portnoybacteria bacterium CG23_combo_of_CG06-09_8_20_14_all_37_13]|uniref:Large ribosomal subunit protein uL2 n=1 Tax=Candidatus Portnoybacteria bacterium CG23_combo_of_CG06-09_8_20_14_all_37_13 TaxID=1974819 RepID=A0A2G9YF47_9BACT|nr:MAG: 50S ribosomal protein L2 [Candidatus Portnoybacteria bacterium CG23_combo_of_CG06-09_8_20_14_all_37_13]